MKRWRISILALVGMCIARSAYANDPPAPPAWLAEFSIVPLALLVFSWSGAAKLYDEASGKPGRRGRILLVAVLITFFSGMHEGYAFFIAPLLGVYAVVIGVRMLAVSSRAPAKSYTRTASRIGGIVLIPTALFLASFGWVFMGSYRYRTERWAAESLPQFREHQRNYAQQHDRKFQELRIADKDRAESDSGEYRRQWFDAGMFSLSEFSGRLTEIEITYGADMKSYQIKIKPIAFIPWPYRLFSPRGAYFMKEDGVIHYERSWSANTEATAASPTL